MQLNAQLDDFGSKTDGFEHNSDTIENTNTKGRLSLDNQINKADPKPILTRTKT